MDRRAHSGLGHGKNFCSFADAHVVWIFWVAVGIIGHKSRIPGEEERRQANASLIYCDKTLR